MAFFNFFSPIMMCIRTLAGVAAALLISGASAQTLGLRLILVGDSTMAPRSGYGNALCEQFPLLACLNLARGGRSTKSYRAEGLWNSVTALLREGGQKDLVLIQFGHNDQPGKPGRSTDLATEFPVNLAAYVDEVRAAGGTPILLTPLTRRSFKDGRLNNDLLAWAEATRKVAADKGVQVLDLNALSAAAVQAMGEDEADTLALAPKPASSSTPASPAADPAATEPQGQPKSLFDRTHVGPKGAALFAGIVARELLKLRPELAPAQAGRR